MQGLRIFFELVAIITYIFPNQTWLWLGGVGIGLVLCIASLVVYFLLKRRVGELQNILKDIDNMKTS